MANSKQSKQPRTERAAGAAAGAPGPLVEAVAFLKAPRGRAFPAPEESRAAAQRALGQARTATGLEPDAAVVFDKLNSLSVRAPQRFVAALAEAADVAHVQANQLQGPVLIAPVKKKQIKLQL